jgi:hypothetical protein
MNGVGGGPIGAPDGHIGGGGPIGPGGGPIGKASGGVHIGPGGGGPGAGDGAGWGPSGAAPAGPGPAAGKMLLTKVFTCGSAFVMNGSAFAMIGAALAARAMRGAIPTGFPSPSYTSAPRGVR